LRFYAVNLNIEGKVCIVVGGGKVAERKIRNILFCGGRVRVVSPELITKLAEMAENKKIGYVKCEYRPDVLKKAYLVFAATSNRKVNSKIAKDAKEKGILVNVCDSAKKSTFILPAILRKKGMVISVSTGGVSPQKAVKIRDKIKEIV